MNAARTGYEALEALTDGTITDEERAWLDARAKESPEWAAALKAHAPPSPEVTDRYVEAILKVLDEDKVVPLRPRRWLRPAAAGGAIAAGLLIFALMPRTPSTAVSSMPSYAVSREGSGMCPQGTFRAGEPSGECGLFVLRPATSAAAGALAVQVYDEHGALLSAARTEQKDNGLLHVFLSPADTGKNVAFVIGTTADLPRTYEEAKAAGRLIR